MLAMSSLRFDDPAYAARIADGLTALRSSFAHCFTALFCPTTWPLACAQSGAGQHDAAVASMEEALASLEAFGFRAHLPRATLDLGRILLRRGGEGDREHASVVLADARERATTYRSPGLVSVIDEEWPPPTPHRR
jgi:hypothetical protein